MEIRRDRGSRPSASCMTFSAQAWLKPFEVHSLTMRRLSALTVAAASLAIRAAEPIRVLFVGNSYTYVHDLPHQFEHVAESLGADVEVNSSTIGGCTLYAQQAEFDNATAALLAQGWDYIVLQDYSVLPAVQKARELYLEPAVRGFISRRGRAKIVLYMTWGYHSGLDSACPSSDVGNCFPLGKLEDLTDPSCHVSRSFQDSIGTFECMGYALARGYFAAKDVGADLVAPCGLAWQVVRGSKAVPDGCRAAIDAQYDKPAPLALPLQVPEGEDGALQLYIMDPRTRFDATLGTKAKTMYDKHQNLAGCYLNALVLYTTIFGKSPLGSAPPNAPLTDANLVTLQKAAQGAVRECGAACGQAASAAGAADDAGDGGRPGPRDALLDVLPFQGRSRNGVFSDRGAWHGFALPAGEAEVGGFSGPMVHGQWNGAKRIWMSPKALVRFAPSQNWGEALPKPSGLAAGFVPGALRQEYYLGKLLVKQELAFVGRRVSAVRVAVTNTGRAALGLQFNYEGTADAESQLKAANPAAASGDSAGVSLRVPVSEATKTKGAFQPVVNVRFDPSWAYHVSVKEGTSYSTKSGDPYLMMPGQRRVVYYTVSLCIDENEQREAKELSRQFFAEPEGFFRTAAERWDGYLRSTVGDVGSGGPSELQRIAAKAVSTLILNWRGASGTTLLHDGVQPSITTFHGFWAWDSWKKHAAALSMFDLELAKSQLRVMFDFQGTSGGKEGMVPDKANLPPEGGQAWGNTKPPLAAWAAWLVYLRGGRDVSFLKEMFPKLEAYHGWWFRFRDHDQNGLCEFGATGNSTQAAKWESGMDNAPRFDGLRGLLRNGPKGQGWSAAQDCLST
ncbi:unnamed protein product [Prorocentrum cordatum]|uniref:Uncharacterized protein n=1 Tax=Prorocentrum cordatum TaxID=2364126 RepID=A0ABN9VPL4_9DINO|nr:unnamed protein product [Polarella glacialis]